MSKEPISKRDPVNECKSPGSTDLSWLRQYFRACVASAIGSVLAVTTLRRNSRMRLDACLRPLPRLRTEYMREKRLTQPHLQIIQASYMPLGVLSALCKREGDDAQCIGSVEKWPLPVGMFGGPDQLNAMTRSPDSPNTKNRGWSRPVASPGAITQDHEGLPTSGTLLLA